MEASPVIQPSSDKPVFGIELDFYEFLKDRLEYIERFFDAVVSPLEERKRSIDEHREPYIDRRHPDDCDEPAFLSEWLDADEYIGTIGFLCLSLLNKTLENYTRMFVMREFSLRTAKELSVAIKSVPKQNDGPTMRYLRWLESENHTLFLWGSSPVNRLELEDITVTRNLFMHDQQLDGRSVWQSSEHFTSNGHSAFSDLRWAGMFGDDEYWSNPQRLVVNRKNFIPALHKVRVFCEYLQRCRTR